MTIELARVSEAWKKLFRQSRRYLTHHLHLINQCLLQAQTLWQNSFVSLRQHSQHQQLVYCMSGGVTGSSGRNIEVYEDVKYST